MEEPKKNDELLVASPQFDSTTRKLIRETVRKMDEIAYNKKKHYIELRKMYKDEDLYATTSEDEQQKEERKLEERKGTWWENMKKVNRKKPEGSDDEESVHYEPLK